MGTSLGRLLYPVAGRPQSQMIGHSRDVCRAKSNIWDLQGTLRGPMQKFDNLK